MSINFLPNSPCKIAAQKWNERKKKKVFRYFFCFCFFSSLFVKLKTTSSTMKRWNQNVLWHLLENKQRRFWLNEKTLNELRRNCFFLIKKVAWKISAAIQQEKVFDVLCFSWRFFVLTFVLTLFHGLFSWWFHTDKIYFFAW